MREQKNECKLVSWADTEVQFTEKCPGGFPGLISVFLRLRVVTLAAWQVVFSSMPREGGWLDNCRSGAFQASTLEGEGGKQCRVFAKEGYKD